MDAERIVRHVRAEHDALRRILGNVEALARRAGDPAAELPLRRHGLELHARLCRHLDLEECELLPALAEEGDWGFALADRIRREHETFIGLRELAATDARLKRIVEQNSVKSQLANQMRDILRGRAISMLTIVVVNDPFEKDREMIRFYELGSHYQSARLELEPMLSDPVEIELLQNIDTLTRINQPLMVRTVDLGLEGYTFLAFDLLQREAIPLQRQLVEKLDDLIGLQRKSTETARLEAEEAYQNTRWLMLVLGFAAAGIAIVVAGVVIRRTARLTGETERERTKFQTLFETNTEGIVILDRERFLECNAATLEIFRIPSEQEFLARRPEDLGMPRQQDGHSAAALANHYIREAFEHGHALFTWEGRVPGNCCWRPGDLVGHGHGAEELRDDEPGRGAAAGH